ncbi:hypothetical protein ACVRXQ_06605 [Streptococcus panodentis]|uniref:hypothetical protein n=1 Tax=Streptococcus panodentis TaxID=1581472 RepID=UPI001AE7F567|nr:hypothetical protein [Streptococcus panodentis]
MKEVILEMIIHLAKAVLTYVLYKCLDFFFSKSDSSKKQGFRGRRFLPHRRRK